MSKKKKRKKRKERDYSLLFRRCEHPLSIEIAGREVVLISYRDFGKEHVEVFQNLDMFVGLDGMWSMVSPPSMICKSSLQKYLDMYLKNRVFLDSLMVLPVEDMEVSEVVYQIVAEAFRDGLNIGFGCVGGHGRTGWLAARLIREFEGYSGDEAVRRIRRRFCKECVESKTQLKDLGCEKVKPKKSEYYFGGSGYAELV